MGLLKRRQRDDQAGKAMEKTKKLGPFEVATNSFI
jgi:hypothetical protein